MTSRDAGLGVLSSWQLPVGLALAWLLIGVLTYQNTHLLYTESFEDVVDTRGFRALTAVGTLYFGLVVWGSIASSIVPGETLLATTSLSEINQTGAVLVGGFLICRGAFARSTRNRGIHDVIQWYLAS